MYSYTYLIVRRRYIQYTYKYIRVGILQIQYTYILVCTSIYFLKEVRIYLAVNA